MSDAPALAETTPFSSTELCLTIGDVTTRVVSRDPGLAITAPDAVARFRSSSTSVDIVVGAQWSARLPLAGGPVRFDSGGLWQLRDDGSRLSWIFTSPKFGSEPYKVAVFNHDFTAGEVHLNSSCFDPTAPIYPLEYPLDELIVTNWLAHGRGVEMHACGVIDSNGDGYLFAGHSGAGKTTIASLWCQQPGVTVLSDDRIILRRQHDGIWMYGTPWHGDEALAVSARARVTRGFFLNHGTTNAVETMTPSRATASLMVRCFPPFYSRERLDFTLSLLEQVATVVPFAELHLIPTAAAIAFIRETS